MTKSERMVLKSMDIPAKKREQLKNLFPEVFMEDKIDFDQLKRVLGEWVESGKERFGLNWSGKSACMEIIKQPSVATLKPVREESVNFDEAENLFIEGDNLEVLKLLQRSYSGKVKVIYIDPPYNTGKEFIYPDKYGETLNTYLAYTGQINSDGKKFSTNTDAVGRYHSNWLKMMYPRLYLARNLLRDDGAIFISIDDHEQANLLKLCDEIFGEENMLAMLAWQGMDTIKNDARHFSKNSEYILVYAKNLDDVNVRGIKKTEKQRKKYKNRDNDPRGDYLLTPLHAKSGSNSSIYSYVFGNGQEWSPPNGCYPRFSKKTLRKLEEEGELFLDPNGKNVPQRKTYLSETGDRMRPTTFWSYENFGSTRNANAELKHLLGGGIFSNPKPVKLIKQIIDLVSGEKADDIILDFFCGSGTTALATMQLNAEDGGNRKFVCVQLPEPCDEESEAFKGGYKTIAEIGMERIRRSAKKIKEENSCYNSGFGFKSFKLACSNFKIWEARAAKVKNLEKQLFDHIDHIVSDDITEDILYELLLQAGLPLTVQVRKTLLVGKDVFSIDGGALLICLDKELNQAVIDAMAQTNAKKVICLDEGFEGNDQLKVNAVQTFKARAREEESEIVFKTV